MNFFQGQRAGRELWNDKPVDVQDKDIESFSKDVAFLKDFIIRQNEEIERLKNENNVLIENDISTKYPTRVLCVKGVILTKSLDDYDDLIDDIGAEAIKEFAARLKNFPQKGRIDHNGVSKLAPFIDDEDIDNLVKEMCT